MNRMRKMFYVALVVMFASLSFNVQAQINPTRGNNRTTRVLLDRLNDSSSKFSATLDATLDRSRYDGTRREDDINAFVRDYQDSVRQLRERFDDRTATAADAQDVLNRAAAINDFLQRNRLNARVHSDWDLVRTDLNALAQAYGVTWPRGGRIYGNNGGNQGTYGNQGTSGNQGGIGNRASRLTGTYRLDTQRSDDPRDAAQRATRSLPYRDRQAVLDTLTTRLEAPDQIAIDRRGRTVMIASTRSPQITFEADGRDNNEMSGGGRAVRARATLNGDQLIVSSTGDRGNDFNVTFDPIDNGRSLSVTRRVYTDRLTTPVVVQSVYSKVSDIADFNVYNGTQNSSTSNNNGSVGTNASGDFVIANGTQLVATLNDNLSTRDATDGQRFTMTVRDPSQYDGATIEGHVTGVSRSGRVTGRSGMTFNFDTIRLRDGGSYRFAGLVQSARTSNGETVRVDTEGSVQEGDSRGNTTAQRAAVGTAVGAIIGAIAGGGKGAAIGAVVGAGGGAGSVYVQGRDDLELLSGSEVTIRATGPR